MKVITRLLALTVFLLSIPIHAAPPKTLPLHSTPPTVNLFSLVERPWV